jgi:glycine/D-amino acid oxidase-like deaminating enzyme
VHEISASEVKNLFHLCQTEDVLSGFYVASDGRVNPVDATMALAKGARLHGAHIIEGVRVLGVDSTEDRFGRRSVTAVRTDQGVIHTDRVANCAGMWARQLAELSGVSVPNQAAEHYYLLTDRIKEVDPTWPVLEDPRNCTYIRPEGGGLLVGLFETDAAAWSVPKVPRDFSFGTLEPDWERMGPFVERAMQRVPAALSAGVKTFFCGPESFTPDGGPIVGEAPEMRGYFVAAGLNSIGILSGGGIGRVLARWIKHGVAQVCNMYHNNRHNYTPYTD